MIPIDKIQFLMPIQIRSNDFQELYNILPKNYLVNFTRAFLYSHSLFIYIEIINLII